MADDLTSDQKSAKASLLDFLGQYGLADLGQFAWNEFLHGVPVNQIMLDIRGTDTYQKRFPAMAELAKQGRAVSESQYIQLENSYRDVMHAYGLPQGFYDQPQDFAKFMTGNVSPQELNQRVSQYSQAVLGDQTTLSELSRIYGEVGHTNNPAGDLLAHYLDPTKAVPLLQRQYEAAAFSAAGVESGYGGLTKAQAEQYSIGTTPGQAQQGFGTLVQDKELFGGLPGEGQGQISEDTQLGAAFGGNEKAREQIQSRAKLRVAEGAGASSFSASREGVSGLAAQDV